MGAQSTLGSVVRSARFGRPGWLEAEIAYRAGLDTAEQGATEGFSLHTGELLLAYPVRDGLEFGLGWHVFGVVPTEGLDPIQGVGDPYAEGKFSLIRLPDGDRPAALSLLVRARPGVGQFPVTRDGLTLSTAALYTLRISGFELDLNGGVAVNTADDPTVVALPLGARLMYPRRSWLNLYVEVVERLHVPGLRESQLHVAGGVGLAPSRRVAFDIVGGLGLSESLPAGFLQLGMTLLTTPLGGQ